MFDRHTRAAKFSRGRVYLSFNDPIILQPIISGDRVKLFVTVKGALSYDTQIGGSTTVPEFSAAMIDQIPQ